MRPPAVSLACWAMAWWLIAAVRPIAFLTPHAQASYRTSPAILELQLLVPRHADNRSVIVWWESPDPSAQTGGFQRAIEGLAGPVLVPIEPLALRLTPGRYEFYAELHGVDRRGRLVTRGHDERRVTVCGGLGPC